MIIALLAFLYGIVEEIVVPIPSAAIAVAGLLSDPYDIFFMVVVPSAFGSTMGSLALFLTGKFAGRKIPDNIRENRFYKIVEKAGKDEVSIVLLRSMPFVPFSVVSAVAGASDMKAESYLPATFLGAVVRNSILAFPVEFLSAFMSPLMSVVVVLVLAFVMKSIFQYLAPAASSSSRQ